MCVHTSLPSQSTSLIFPIHANTKPRKGSIGTHIYTRQLLWTTYGDPGIVNCLSSRSISARIFHLFIQLQNLLYFFSHAHDTRTQDKIQENIVLVQRNKHRLHCTQDGLPQDGLTASSYRLILNHRTLGKGHVILLNPPLCNQLVDQAMLLNHALDLTGYSQFHDTMKPGGSYQMKIGLDITIQSRTHCLSYFQLGLGCDS